MPESADRGANDSSRTLINPLSVVEILIAYDRFSHAEVRRGNRGSKRCPLSVKQDNSQ